MNLIEKTENLNFHCYSVGWENSWYVTVFIDNGKIYPYDEYLLRKYGKKEFLSIEPFMYDILEYGSEYDKYLSKNLPKENILALGEYVYTDDISEDNLIKLINEKFIEIEEYRKREEAKRLNKEKEAEEARKEEELENQDSEPYTPTEADIARYKYLLDD